MYVSHVCRIIQIICDFYKVYNYIMEHLVVFMNEECKKWKLKSMYRLLDAETFDREFL